MQSLEYFILKGSKTLINCVVVSKVRTGVLDRCGESSVVFHTVLWPENIINGP